jgi:hypothetical protein
MTSVKSQMKTSNILPVVKMYRHNWKHKYSLTLLLVALIVSSIFYVLIPGTYVNAIPSTKFTLEQHGKAIQTIDVPVGSDFTIEVWIRGIPQGFSLVGFDFVVTWDPTLVEYNYHTTNDHGWPHSHNVDKNAGVLSFNYPTDTSHQVTSDDMWATINFNCLGEGTSQIAIGSVDTIFLWDGQTTPIPVDPAPCVLVCNQFLPRTVGGVTVPTNKLEILTPYLTLAGLAAAVSAVVVIKKRRD